MLTRDQLDSSAKALETRGYRPPMTALWAFASLLADETPVEVIGESFTVGERTVWVLTGVTDACLISVRASSATRYWSWQVPSSAADRPGEDLEASLWPLSAVRSLKVTRVRDTTERGDNSKFEWEAGWTVTLRDGKVLSFPSPEAEQYSADSERIENLVALIRGHLIGTRVPGSHDAAV